MERWPMSGFDDEWNALDGGGNAAAGGGDAFDDEWNAIGAQQKPAAPKEEEHWYDSLLAGAKADQTADLAAASQQFTDTYSSPSRTAATLLGGVAAPVLAAPGAGVLSGALGAAAQTGIDAYSETGDAKESGRRAAWSGALGVGLGAAGRLAGETLGDGANWIGEKISGLSNQLQSKGWQNRASAAGFYGHDLRRVAAQNRGDAMQNVENLGRKIEDAGLHKGDGMFGWLPGSAERYGDNAAMLREEGLAQMNSAERELAGLEGGPQIDMRDVRAKLGAGAQRSRGRWDPEGDEESVVRQQFADRIPEEPVDWTEALQERRYYDDLINRNRPGGISTAPLKEEIRRDIADQMRGKLTTSLDEAAARGEIGSDVADNWRGGAEDFSLGALVGDVAAKREIKNLGNQAISMPAWIAGAGASGGNPLVGVATARATDFVKNRARSAIAGTYGAAASGAETVGDAAIQLGQQLEQSGAMLGPAVNAYTPYGLNDEEAQRQYALRKLLEQQQGMR